MARKSNSSSKRESAPLKRLARNAPAKAFLFALIFGAGCVAAQAYPGSRPPAPASTPAPNVSSTPIGNVLPFDSRLIFVLDDTLSSKGTQKGQIVHAHLRDALVIGGVQLAPAGAPEEIRVTGVSKADIGDVYGFVDVYFEPLALADGRTLPLRSPVSRLSPHRSAGHESTVQIEDQIENQVIPYHVLYHIFRSGKNFVLNPGAELPAQTEATLTAMPNGTVAIQTPQPPVHTTEMPKSTFPVMPVATPYGPATRSTSPKRPAPLPTPTPTPTASPSPTPSA